MSQQHEATELLDEVVKACLDGAVNLRVALRKCLHACRLLGWDEPLAWFQRELGGYPIGFEVPLYRTVQGTTGWKDRGPTYDVYMGVVEAVFDRNPERLPAPTSLDVVAGIEWILEVAETGYLELSGSTSERWSDHRRSKVEIEEYRQFDARVFKRCLSSIERMMFEWASQHYALLRYGNLMEDVWSSHRKLAEEALRKAQLAGHLDAIDGCLKSSTPESWRSAVLACRNLLMDLANHLWRDERPEYAALPGDRGGKLDVSQGRHLNRISAYLHEKGLRGSVGGFRRAEIDRLDTSIRALNSVLSSAKNEPMTIDRARSVALGTYLLIAELAAVTDMEPVLTVN